MSSDYSFQLYVGSAVDDLPLMAIEFRVLGRIARRGECSESARSMAETCYVSERTIRLTFSFLRKAGLIIETERTGQATIRKLADSSNWKPAEDFAEIRKSVTEGWKKSALPLQPQPQTPATTDRGRAPAMTGTPATTDRGRAPAMTGTPATTAADPCNESREPLQPQPQTPATTAAHVKNSQKVIPEGNPNKGESRAREPKPKKKETPLPDDFSLTDEMREWARLQCEAKGLELDVGSQTERFKNHALAKDRRQVNWQAAWRNWILSALENGWGTTPRKENVNGFNAKSQGNSGSNSATGKSAPGGFKVPKPTVASEQSDLLELFGQGLDNGGGQGRETVQMSAPENHGSSVESSSVEIQKAEIISIKTSPRYSSEAERRYHFG